MCFRRSPSDKPSPLPPSGSPCVLATRLPVWWDDVYNNGERQSNFTQHARQGSHLSARPPRHIWKEMRLKTTLTSCTGRRAKKGVGGLGAEACHTRASDAISPWQGACQNEEISHFVASPLFPTFCRSSPELYLLPPGLSLTHASAMKSTRRRPNGLLCVTRHTSSYLVLPREDEVIPPDPHAPHPGVMCVFPLTHYEHI